MTPKVFLPPSVSGQLPGGSVSASAGAFHSDTGTAQGPVSAAGGQLHSHAAARLIRGAATLLFAALLTFGMGHTATKAVANLAHDMQAKGW